MRNCFILFYTVSTLKTNACAICVYDEDFYLVGKELMKYSSPEGCGDKWNQHDILCDRLEEICNAVPTRYNITVFSNLWKYPFRIRRDNVIHRFVTEYRHDMYGDKMTEIKTEALTQLEEDSESVEIPLSSVTKYFEELDGGKLPVSSLEDLSQNFKDALASKDGSTIKKALLKLIEGLNPNIWRDYKAYIKTIAEPEVVEDFGDLSYREALLVCNSAGKTLEILFNNLIDSDLEDQDKFFNVMYHI